MSGNELKEMLTDNNISDILKQLGCKHISDKNKYFSCSNPDGDNSSAIVVFKNSLKAENYTRSEFNEYNVKDIISLVQFITSYNYYEAVKFICDICGINYYSNRKQNSLLSLIRKIDSNSFSDDNNIKTYDKSILDIFYKNASKKWIDEGLSFEAHNIFDIRFDLDSERIVIPIYDEIGNLIGVKGRLLKDNGDSKYIYLYECPKSTVLYGLYQNYKNIKEKDHVIIVEGEKSVIKLYSHGYKNVVAIGGKIPSKIQIEKIIRLGVNNITIAFDKDVKNNEIKSICKKFDIGLDILNIEYLYDSFNFMNEKDSPSDDMSVFDILFNNRYKYVPV